MALVGIELETLVSEPDALTTRPPPSFSIGSYMYQNQKANFLSPKRVVYSLQIFH